MKVQLARNFHHDGIYSFALFCISTTQSLVRSLFWLIYQITMANRIIQAQLKENASVMRENISRESQGEEILQSLDEMSERLAPSSQEYCSNASKRCKKMLWRSVKWRLCLVGSVIILLIATIVIPVVVLLHRYQPTLVAPS
jgi:Synaptobrevin